MMETEEVKSLAFLRQMHDPGLVSLRRKAEVAKQHHEPLKGSIGLGS